MAQGDVNSGEAEFSPSFVERIRQMEFPQLTFLPKHTGLFQVDSLLRFDECQSVFTAHLKPTGFALNDALKKFGSLAVNVPINGRVRRVLSRDSPK